VSDESAAGSPGPLRELVAMLASLRPERVSGDYAYCELPAGTPIPDLAICSFREPEGTTVILPVAVAAAAGFPVRFEAAWITLGLDSDLGAIGLTAAVSSALADVGIACNVVAALRRDHLFVPSSRGAEAVQVLLNLRQTAGTTTV
jgi:hypothetical protein